MHCLRARAYITWSVAGSWSARHAMADHASVKVIMALLRRITVFCNHLPQWLYHQVHQALSNMYGVVEAHHRVLQPLAPVIVPPVPPGPVRLQHADLVLQFADDLL